MLKLISNVYFRIFANTFFIKLNKLIYILSLRGLGVLNFESDKASGEDNFIKTHISKIKDGVIFDVGANIGNYSKNLRKSNSSVNIFCFEPHPINFEILEKNTKKFDLNLNIFQYGVGSSAGILKLYDYAENDGTSHASLYRDVIEEIHKSHAISHEVNIITLDEFSDQHGITNICLLKIDTEGHELEVLRGFQKHIRAGAIELIHFEFNEMNIASRVFFKDFWDFLPEYDFYRMLPNGLLPIKYYNPLTCEIFAYQNILAKRKISHQ